VDDLKIVKEEDKLVEEALATTDFAAVVREKDQGEEDTKEYHKARGRKRDRLVQAG